jgi:hypothetical protein
MVRLLTRMVLAALQVSQAIAFTKTMQTTWCFAERQKLSAPAVSRTESRIEARIHRGHRRMDMARQDIDGDNNNNPFTVSETIWNASGRKTMSGLASIGAVETAYLTYVKLFGGGDAGISKLCTTLAGGNTSGGGGSCGDVLQSSYASIGNIPLTLFGFCGECVT